ncbi:hypothetical protein KPH14_010363 [Odynerus spinipes]|uniref:Uncharacterized protein n=1 Tax=Odynerus spinipes TaxID=1348599 RepID=A0AAD9VT37_9HYME|nr:hypothetical protein KPH14_010363 [Odynerus spinipes]
MADNFESMERERQNGSTSNRVRMVQLCESSFACSHRRTLEQFTMMNYFDSEPTRVAVLYTSRNSCLLFADS